MKIYFKARHIYHICVPVRVLSPERFALNGGQVPMSNAIQNELKFSSTCSFKSMCLKGVLGTNELQLSPRNCLPVHACAMPNTRCALVPHVLQEGVPWKGILPCIWHNNTACSTRTQLTTDASNGHSLICQFIEYSLSMESSLWWRQLCVQFRWTNFHCIQLYQGELSV